MNKPANLLARYSILLRNGQRDEARRLAVRALRTSANDADLALALIRVAQEAGNHELSGELCDRVLSRHKDWPPGLLYRGIAHMATDAPDLACRLFQRGHEIHPSSWEFLVNLGMALERLRRIPDAVAAYEKAIVLHPTCYEALMNLGNTLQSEDRDQEALERYAQAIECAHDNPLPRYNRAILLKKLGRLKAALLDLDAAVALNPQFIQAWNDRGITLAFLGQYDAALESCDRALQLAPAFAHAMVNRGVVLNYLGQFSGALAEFERARLHLGETVEILAGLSLAMRGLGELNQSIDLIDRCIRMQPNRIRSHIDRAVILSELGRYDEAKRSYEFALGLMPEDSDATFNLALLNLARGDLDAGWAGYEYRWTRTGAEPRVFEDISPWKGETLRDDEALLVWSEQGVGDEILFSSIYGDLKSLGKRCVFECRGKLLPIFRRSFPWATFISRDAPLADPAGYRITYQIPAGSLPRQLRRRLEDFPAINGHLAAAPERIETWRTRLDALGAGLKIGFSWRSSNLTGDRSLSCMKILDMAPLFQVHGVHWVALQYDDCLAELDDARSRLEVPIHRFQDVDHLDDLDEVGALMSALDLIITAPTSISLQAAAHGIPTWHFSYGPEWQCLGTAQFPWLRTLRRFERKWDETWYAVSSRAASELRKLLSAARTNGDERT